MVARQTLLLSAYSEDTSMATRKRARNETGESSPQKRQRQTAAPLRPTRSSTRKKTSQNVFPPKLSQIGEGTVGDDAGDSSDSSSLSDPPSTVASRTPADSPKVKPVAKSRKVVANQSAVRKASAKEHEEALNLFLRDSSDEESDCSFEKEKTKGAQRINENSDEEDDDAWEDVDLSHRHELSLDDLHVGEEPQDLEVTLERTQQSMRLKYARFRSVLKSRNKAASAAEKKIRMHTHLLHVQCLLIHGAIRNAWLEDEELQVIRSVSWLMS